MTLPLDPVAFSIGPFSVHWYGLMYVFAFFAAYVLGHVRARRVGWKTADVDDFLTWAMVGVILGGRIGYVLFYDLPVFLKDPLEIVRIWHGGMSFHGGLIGVAVAMFLWARRHGRHPVDVLDFVAPLVPPGLFFGRIGNFINGELWGAVTSCPLGLSPAPGAAPRHPSQLYEAALEGLVLFAVLWFFPRGPSARTNVAAERRGMAYQTGRRGFDLGVRGRMSGLFLLLYGLFRFAVEFVRMPDVQIGYLAWGWLTMGQVLSLPLVLIGACALFRSLERE